MNIAKQKSQKKKGYTMHGSIYMTFEKGKTIALVNRSAVPRGSSG